MILSASRRTDIPAFYSEWFMNRLKEGHVLTRNPMNPNQVSRITLSPDTIDCIVFWTKDPMSMMDKLPELEAMGYHYYFQFTLTPYERDIERNLRDKKDITKTFRKLSESSGKERVLWRYDPIIINDIFSADYHLKSFQALCNELQGYTDICTISFVDKYSKLSKAVKNDIIKNISEEQMYQLAAGISEIGQSHDIELRACCEKLDFSKQGIRPAACIDSGLVEHICGHAIHMKKDNSQRLSCGCIQSVDIGVYNTCGNGCVYCYANHSDESIRRNCLMHNPESDILIGSVNKNDKIKER